MLIRSLLFLVSRSGVGQNAGLAFIKLKDWSERTTPESQIGAIIQRGMALNMIVKDASYIMPLQLPAMPELGVSSGFNIQLKDVSGQGHEKLIAAKCNFRYGITRQTSCRCSSEWSRRYTSIQNHC
jgi:multidrug efflux pump subunit AcrB